MNSENLLRKLCALLALVSLSSCTTPNREGPSSPAPNGHAASSDPFFFAGPIDGYGQQLKDSDRAALMVRRALRRIDPCGFVDLAADAPKIPHLTHFFLTTAFDGCLLVQDPKAEPRSEGIKITLRNAHSSHRTPGDNAPTPSADGQTGWDVNGVRVTGVAGSSLCRFSFDLKLADLPGAPKDPEAVAILNDETLSVESNAFSDHGCESAKAVATSAARISARGLPHRDARSPIPAPLLDHEPCSVFPDLTGFSGYKAEPLAPYSCVFLAASGPEDSVRLFFDSIRDDFLKEAPETEQKDGLTLYKGLLRTGERRLVGCRVDVPAGKPLTPVYLDPQNDNPEQDPVPVIEVSGKDCDQTEQAALAAAKKFT